MHIMQDATGYQFGYTECKKIKFKNSCDLNN